MILPLQDINTPCIMTDNAQEFGDEENTDFETVFVLADFDSPDYSYLYKRDSRIVGPPVVLHCAAKEEVSRPLFLVKLRSCMIFLMSGSQK